VMSIMGPSVLTMGAVVTMVWGNTVTAQEAGPVSGAVGGPYLDSFTVQDSCQFNLCGPEYSQEFLLGSVPKVGSCSGDCNLLAINLVSNRFIKDWLWSNCASMCNSKYDFQSYRHYKSRFQCMEKCHTAYQSLSPHHNLARYCAKVSCSTLDRKSYQVDCYTGCAAHVAGNVSGSDWKDWGLAMAGHCSGLGLEENKLSCADTHLWAGIVKTHELLPTDQVVTSCHSDICDSNLRCSRDCLTAATALHSHSRHLWVKCSQSPQCKTENTRGLDKINCVEKCVEKEIEEQRKQEALERERKKLQEQRRQQALLSGGAGLSSGTILVIISWAVLATLSTQ